MPEDGCVLSQLLATAHFQQLCTREKNENLSFQEVIRLEMTDPAWVWINMHQATAVAGSCLATVAVYHEHPVTAVMLQHDEALTFHHQLLW